MAKRFVLSANEFESIRDAENKVNGWFQGNPLDLNKKTKLYEITVIYDLKLRFEKRKEPSKEWKRSTKRLKKTINR